MVGLGMRGRHLEHIILVATFAREGVEHSSSKTLLPKEDDSNSQAKQTHLRTKGTSKGFGLHVFLELTNYSLMAMFCFNLPPFDMIVIDTNSRFTFKVNRGGRVGHTITKRTK